MQWFENEDFWSTFYTFMFHERRWAAAPEEVERVLALSGIKQGAVLDLCCGPARHSVLLADKGFRVTGVDRSPFLLNKAREHAGTREIDLVQSDMREFVRRRGFDLALSLFTSFGFFETREEDLKVLQNVRASLKEGGVFIIDVLGRECIAANPTRTWWEEMPEGIHIQHSEILPGWTRLRSRWLLVKDDKTYRTEFKLNVYSGQELMDALHRAGFEKVQIFGSLAGTPYDDKASRLVARAS